MMTSNQEAQIKLTDLISQTPPLSPARPEELAKSRVQTPPASPITKPTPQFPPEELAATAKLCLER